MKEKSAGICKKHPDLKYCPPTKNLTKSDFDLCDKLSIKEDLYDHYLTL